MKEGYIVTKVASSLFARTRCTLCNDVTLLTSLTPRRRERSSHSGFSRQHHYLNSTLNEHKSQDNERDLF